MSKKIVVLLFITKETNNSEKLKIDKKNSRC